MLLKLDPHIADKSKMKGSEKSGQGFLDDYMETYRQLVQKVPLPNMMLVRQHFEKPIISDIPAALQKELMQQKIKNSITPGMAIAITCGSRGISNIALILKEIVRCYREMGADPFIIPAMGSHGGATAEGQLEVLTSYGVTEDYCGCSIRSSMETVIIGKTETGLPVYMDKYAAQADGIIVVGRIKAHTAFSGPYESGLMKMLAVGMGKRDGAEACHRTGFRLMHELVPEYGKAVIRLSPVLFGIGLIENAYDETCIIQALTPDEIIAEEPNLLVRAKQLMGKILLPDADLLIVDRIGKNISGDGADPNITGSFATPYVKGGLNAQKRVVLDLTEETQGNAMGMGMYDATTKRLFQKIDYDKTYTNPIISTAIHTAKIPMIMESDKEAISVCLKTCPEIDPLSPKIIRIKDSLHIDTIWVSEAYMNELSKYPQLELIGASEPFNFDSNGNLDLNY